MSFTTAALIAAIAFAAMSVAMAVVALMRGGVLGRAKAAGARCGACGYSSEGMLARCPECGGAAAEVGLETPALRARLAAPRWVGLGAWFVLFAAACGGVFHFGPQWLSGTVLSRQLYSNVQSFCVVSAGPGGRGGSRVLHLQGLMRALEGEAPSSGMISISENPRGSTGRARLEVDLSSGACTVYDRFGAASATAEKLDEAIAAAFYKADGVGGDAGERARDVEDLLGVLRFLAEGAAYSGAPRMLNLSPSSNGVPGSVGGLQGSISVWYVPSGTVYIRGLDRGWGKVASPIIMVAVCAGVALGGAWLVMRRSERVRAAGLPTARAQAGPDMLV